MKKIGLNYLIITVFAIAVAVAFTSCDEEEHKEEPKKNQPPTCNIITLFNTDESITVTAIAEDKDGYIVEVQFYVDNGGYIVLKEFPYKFTIKVGELRPGSHVFRAVAKDNQNATAEATTSLVIDQPNAEIAIGRFYRGGVIAYIDESGKHGLIATISDQSEGIKWYNGSSIHIGATETEIGTGRSNTIKIAQAQGEGSYAAKLCDELILNGYNDWFLPSKDELNELYQNRRLIDGFSTSSYWSSSENDQSSAWRQYFGNGNQYYSSKKSEYRVRPIRAF